MGRFSICGLVYTGSKFSVYKAIDTITQSTQIIKVPLKASNFVRLATEEKLPNSARLENLICRCEDGERSFGVFELYGPNLESVVSIHKHKRLPIETLMRTSIEMLRCIKELHQNGFLHTDINPSHFLLTSSRSHPLALIDLTKIVPSNYNKSIHTNLVYASPMQLENHPPTELDDIFSWFYSVAHLAGVLIWNGDTENEEHQRLRTVENFSSALESIPEVFEDIYESLFDEHPPSIDELIEKLSIAATEEEVSWTLPFSWELLPPQNISKISPTPIVYTAQEDPDIPELAEEPFTSPCCLVF